MPTIGPVSFDGPIGFGTMSLSGNLYAKGDLSEQDAIALIKAAYREGVRLFNTSDLYGPYTNEELLGRALKGLEGVVVATKWGPMIQDKVHSMDASPENCRRCCEGAIKRLDRPYIDVFTMRGPEDPKVPIEDTFAEVKKLIAEGKVRAAGLSECPPDVIRRAHAIAPVSCIEMEYSLFSRDIEADFLPLAKELGITVLAYSPLGRGILTGTITSANDFPEGDFRRFAQPRFQGEAMTQNLGLVANLTRISQTKGCTPGQLALAWILAKSRQLGVTIIPIPGTKREKYMVENMGALKVSLSDEEVAQLEAEVDASKVVGDRYANPALTYQRKTAQH